MKAVYLTFPKKYSYILFIPLISVLFLSLSFPSEALKDKRSKDGRFIDHGDGTITDTKTDLMWTKKDSYADLGKCLNWDEANKYVKGGFFKKSVTFKALNTGGYSNWRLPSLKELKTIYEQSKSNNMAHDHDSKYPLHMDSIFADGAAYGYWSSDTGGFFPAQYLSFFDGLVRDRHRDYCSNEGVRAVRR